MNWSFDLTQFDDVWKLLVNLGLALIFLLIGNAIRRVVPFLRKAHIPSALLGGLLLFLFDLLLSAFDIHVIDKRIMQIITYHALAIGFIAMTLKIAKKDKTVSFMDSVKNGAITGGTYMLQAAFGILISLIFFWASNNSFFYDAGVLLPLGYGQGPGNALTWDINFSNMDNSFTGNGSVGLTIASIGFIVASIVGIIYINIYKKKGQIKEKEVVDSRSITDFEENNEIEDSESVDKTSIQVGFVFLAYALAFGIMIFFYYLSKWTNVALFNSVAWGFNFIWGVITANIIKLIIKLLKKKNVIKKKYINNYQMDRISGFAFDLMIIAGVAAIDIDVVTKYIWFILAISVVGAIITIIYVRLMTKITFKDYEHEAFLTNFGTLTGTASNGMIFLREIDPNYETPMSNVFIVSQLPAMIFVAPLLLLLNRSAESLTGCYISLGIFFALFALYTTFLVLASKGIFNKKSKE
ncbi:MAG: hypothetical protein J5666_07825 [Bacilli bacterium]|nr:hypothetical protein [Bacilli bacterium]